jgi:hypothetical protein
MADICEGQNWATDDPLGIGDLLCNAFKVAQLITSSDLEQTSLLETLLDSSLLGLESCMRDNPLKLPAAYRLAFRELGLSIGLHAAEKMRGLIGQSQTFKRKVSAFTISLMQ